MTGWCDVRDNQWKTRLGCQWNILLVNQLDPWWRWSFCQSYVTLQYM